MSRNNRSQVPKCEYLVGNNPKFPSDVQYLIQKLQKCSNSAEVKDVIIETEKVYHKLYYFISKPRQSRIDIFCKYYQKTNCNVYIALIFKGQNEIRVFGYTHADETIENEAFIVTKKQKTEMILLALKEMSASCFFGIKNSKIKQLLLEKQINVSMKDVWRVKQKFGNPSLIQFMNELKTLNQGNMYVDFDVTDTFLPSEKIKKVVPKLKKKEGVVTPDLLEEVLTNTVTCDFDDDNDYFEVDDDSKGIREPTVLKTKSFCVSCLRIIFPIVHTFHNGLPILFIDGTFHKAYHCVLLICCTVDVFGNIILVGVSIFNSESCIGYKYLLEPILNVIGNKDVTVISDQGSGLLKFMGEYNNKNIHHFFCIFHIYSLIIKDFLSTFNVSIPNNKELYNNLFVPLCKTFSLNDYHNYILKFSKELAKMTGKDLEKMKCWVLDQIEKRKPERWVSVKMDEYSKRFGYCCSGIAESYNSKIVGLRRADFTSMLIGIICDEAKIQNDQCRSFTTPHYLMPFSDEVNSIPSNFQVTIDGINYKVSINKCSFICSFQPLKCSCGIPQNYNCLCRHLLAVAKNSKTNSNITPIDVFNYIDKVYTIENYVMYNNISIKIPDVYKLKQMKEMNEFVFFQQRIKKGGRICSTWKDVTALKRWKDN